MLLLFLHSRDTARTGSQTHVSLSQPFLDLFFQVPCS